MYEPKNMNCWYSAIRMHDDVILSQSGHDCPVILCPVIPPKFESIFRLELLKLSTQEMFVIKVRSPLRKLFGPLWSPVIKS